MLKHVLPFFFVFMLLFTYFLVCGLFLRLCWKEDSEVEDFRIGIEIFYCLLRYARGYLKHHQVRIHASICIFFRKQAFPVALLGDEDFGMDLD